ncbi:MAG: flagellar basal body-associated protein FliL [Rhodobacteraceae bacterium]|nr:flagellar basal body-associated protein FliL [Paracoccaceae bacterium]
MLRLVPVVLVVLGALAGGAAGYLARSPGEAPAAAAAPGEVARDYVRLNNQFVVPVVEGGQVRALVILSLTIEAVAGASEEVYLREPRLRDAFLRVLFDHANTGGFRGAFTAGGALELLRAALREAAVRVLGPIAVDVLIVDIARQDA